MRKRGTFRGFQARAARQALLVALLLATPAAAGLSGVVFVDANGNGVLDPGEPRRPGVVVSNGLEVATTDAEGGYSLTEGPRGFAFVTRPADFDCEGWYRRDAGDFALRPREAEDEFFFIHMSDLHVFDRSSEVIEEYELDGSWWTPSLLAAWFTLRRVNDVLIPRFSLDPIADFRKAVSPYRDVSNRGDLRVYLAYYEEFAREGSELGNVERKVEGALAEIAALKPSFVVATGDLVLDANGASREELDRRIALYQRVTASTGVPVYNTIGNHELRGIRFADAEEDPEYGLGFFEATFGPTYYSFDRGDFHFIALDTHRPRPRQDGPPDWTLNRMRDEVKGWLRRDLAAHRSKVKVVLNHEPFFSDPSWPFDAEFLADHVVSDEGIFEDYEVEYSLSGHTHFNGFQRGKHTTYVSAGSLSGFGWFLPADLYPHGYRMVYAWHGQLYSAWKVVGEPLLGFVQPSGDTAIHSASAMQLDPEALESPLDLIAVAADARGPFATVSLELDGRSIGLERWGDYFVHARIDLAPLRGRTGSLTLAATGKDGRTLSARLEVRAGN